MSASPLSPKAILPFAVVPLKIVKPPAALFSNTNSSESVPAVALVSAVLTWRTPWSLAVPTPKVGVVIVLPDCAVNVLAVNWKSSAPSIVTGKQILMN